MLRRIPNSRYLVVALLFSALALPAQDYVRDEGPEVFTYAELLELSKEPVEESLGQ